MRKSKLEELKYLFNLYKITSKTSPEIVKGNFLRIGSSSYTLNNGETIVREELIKNKGQSSASIILPVTNKGEIVLIVQPRVLTKTGVTIELPAGYIDEHETGKEAAIRELKEETGYTTDNIIKIAEYYQDQGCSRALNECFLARNCQRTSPSKLDDDEFISEFVCTYEEMLELVDMNYINDAGSIITIEKTKKLLRR